jgi:hypothetical protein
MRWSRVWLVVTATAFVAWIGYLVYVTQTIERPSTTLSRPQFLLAHDVVIGHVEKKDGLVTVKEVPYSADRKITAGDKIEVKNLRDSFRTRLGEANPPEWDVPADFIIPLWSVEETKSAAAQWSALITPLPPSAGLPHGALIYPVTPGTKDQLKAILKDLP